MSPAMTESCRGKVTSTDVVLTQALPPETSNIAWTVRMAGDR